MVMVHTFTYPTVMYQNTFIYLYMLRDGPLCFDGGRGWGGWKIFTCNIFLYKAPAANNFFLCVAVFLFFSVYSLCKQFTSKRSTPPPPPQKILVRPLTPNLLESPPQKLLILGSSGLLLVISAWKLLLPFL